MIKKIISSFAIALLLCACEFSPSEIPLTEVERPSEDAPAIWIELTPEMDTLRLSAPAWITYSVETGDRQLYQIDVELDNVKVDDLGYDSPQKVRTYIATNSMEDGFK